MFHDADHPDVALSDWQTFREQFSSFLFKEVIDRSDIELPEWFTPLARGIVIASDYLLRRTGYCPGSHRNIGWAKTEPEVFMNWHFSGEDCGAVLTVRQYADQDWWTVERYRDDSTYGNVTDTLAIVFGSAPVFCREHQAAMRLAEYCHLQAPPSGLRWVASCPDDKDDAIAFARRRRADEALRA